MKTWFEIRNAAATDSGPAEILIYDRIGKSYWDDSGVGAKDFAQALKEIPLDREIVVAINSPGGNVFDGLAIYHQLQARHAKVVSRVDGMAASIASIIAMAGRETRMPKNALMMIHDPSGLAYGNADEMRKMASILDKNKAVLVGIYHAKTRKPMAEIEKAMSAETWYTGAEAAAWGLADQATEEVALTNSFDLTHFRNAPKAICHLPSCHLPSAGPVDSPSIPVESKTREIQNMNTATAAAAPAPSPIVVPAPAAETPLSLLDRLKNLLSPAPDNKAEELTNLRTEITNLRAELQQVKASIPTKEAEMQTRANAKASETLAKAGHTAVAAETPGPKAAAKTPDELWAEFKTIQAKDGKKAARDFYLANKAAM